MIKTIEQIQAENRKLILEAIHGCSYKEALKKEEGSECHYLYKIEHTEHSPIRIMGDIKNYGYNKERHHPNAFLVEIIGKPITLNRVLLAIQFSNIEIECDRFVFKKLTISYSIYKIDKFDWDLTRETLEQQSEETQREINKILRGK